MALSARSPRFGAWMSSAIAATAVSAIAAKRSRFTASRNGTLSPGISDLLHLARDSLHFGENAHEVLTHDLADVGFAVTAAVELFANFRKMAHVLHSFRRFRDAIEIRPDADAFDSGDLHDVVDVIDDRGVRHFRQGIRVHQLLQLRLIHLAFGWILRFQIGDRRFETLVSFLL